MLFLTHCSLQSAVDLLSPRYILLFVHGARAIFVEKSVATQIWLVRRGFGLGWFGLGCFGWFDLLRFALAWFGLVWLVGLECR